MKTAITVALLLAASAVLADQTIVLDSKIKVSEYAASISGQPGCKMPSDPIHPRVGECEVKKGRLETGWKLVKIGNTCYSDTTVLVKMHKIRSGALVMDAPETETSREVVKCPA